MTETEQSTTEVTGPAPVSWGDVTVTLPMPKHHIGGWHQTREGEDRPYRGSWYRVKRNGRQPKWLGYVLAQENQIRLEKYLEEG